MKTEPRIASIGCGCLFAGGCRAIVQGRSSKWKYLEALEFQAAGRRQLFPQMSRQLQHSTGRSVKSTAGEYSPSEVDRAWGIWGSYYALSEFLILSGGEYPKP